MATNPVHVMIGFILGLGVALVMSMFVFVSAVYTLLDLLIFLMIQGGVSASAIMLLNHIAVGSWPIYVTIFEKRAGSTYISLDRARRLSKQQQGKFEYHLKGKKATIKPVDFEFLYTGKRGQNFLFLEMSQYNTFNPITLKEAATLAATHENSRYWFSEQLRRNYARWNKQFGIEKYLPLISILIAGIMVALAGYILFNQFGQITSQMGGITGAQAELINQVDKLLTTVTGLTGNIPPGVTPPVVG